MKITVFMVAVLFVNTAGAQLRAGGSYTLERLEKESELILIGEILSSAPIVRTDKMLSADGTALRDLGDFYLGRSYELKISSWLKVADEKRGLSTVRVIYRAGEYEYDRVPLPGREYMLFLTKATLDKEKYENAVTVRRRPAALMPAQSPHILEPLDIGKYYNVVGRNWGLVGDGKRINEYARRLRTILKQ